ncbi:MAG TPA: hypothetical protein PLU30_18070 [Verrucomicrobiae bacterium]|nr:hypothetical protein [Verrucomicrobiae bacterium]
MRTPHECPEYDEVIADEIAARRACRRIEKQFPRPNRWRPGRSHHHPPALELEKHMPENSTTKTTLEFKRLRETKNTVRFEEQTEPGKPPVIGTIYIQKWFIGDAENVTLTMEAK